MALNYDFAEGLFKTTDTSLAAYLITVGYSLMDKIYNGEFATYIFQDDDPKLQQFIRDFQLMRAEAPAAQLIQNYQNLVRQIRRKI